MEDTNIFQFEEKYKNMTDEILIQEAVKNQDEQALDCLMGRYKDIVSMKANKFFMVGSEKDDILQEGYIGLYKAVKSFDAEKQNSFKTFANICIERQLITAVKNSNRQKHIPLNSSVSLNANAYDEGESDTTIIEILDTNKNAEDPLEIITKKEYFDSVEKDIDEKLSDFEKKVLKYYKNGESYAKIATRLGTKVKSVDTAIQRIRKKAIKNMLENLYTTKMSANKNFYTLDLQKQWQQLTGSYSLPQAGIFIKKDSKDEKYLKTVLDKMIESVQMAQTKPNVLIASAVSVDENLAKIGEETLQKAIGNCNLRVEETDKEAIEFYFSQVIQLGIGATVGGKLPDEAFYY